MTMTAEANKPTLTGLPPELITKLMTESRSRNQYGPKLIEFSESDEAAVNVVEAWPIFKGKEASTLYQGFNLAIKKAKLENTIKILKREDDVFLMHLERVQVVLTDADSDTEQDEQ